MLGCTFNRIWTERVQLRLETAYNKHTHLRSPCIYVRKHINGHAWLRDSKRTRSAKDTAQCTCAYLNTRTRVCSALVEDTVTHALSDSGGTKEEEEKEAPGWWDECAYAISV